MESSIDPSKWKEYIKDNNNFTQAVPYDFKKIYTKLQLASENPEKLNPYCTLSAIYDYTKFFASISTGLSMGFSDITEKVEQMREKFQEYQDTENIQDLLYKEIQLGVYKLNGSNNKSLGHGKDQYAKYISASRTFLRLLWFIEYLIDIFENLLKDNGKTAIKKIIGNSYNKVLAPRHTFLVRKAVGLALTFSSGGNVDNSVNIIFQYPEYTEEARKTIKDTIYLMKKIWNGGNDFYTKYKMLDLK